MPTAQVQRPTSRQSSDQQRDTWTPRHGSAPPVGSIECQVADAERGDDRLRSERRPRDTPQTTLQFSLGRRAWGSGSWTRLARPVVAPNPNTVEP